MILNELTFLFFRLKCLLILNHDLNMDNLKLIIYVCFFTRKRVKGTISAVRLSQGEPNIGSVAGDQQHTRQFTHGGTCH